MPDEEPALSSWRRDLCTLLSTECPREARASAEKGKGASFTRAVKVRLNRRLQPLTVVLDPESTKIVDHFHGRNRSLREDTNREFSAVGHLSPLRGKLEVTLFENAFAKVKLPFDSLPPCFDLKRVEITYSVHD